MAEYSREYFELIGENMPGDFSYRKEFSKLKEGEYFYEICEGFGTIGITRINNKPFVETKNGETINWDQFLLDSDVPKKNRQIKSRGRQIHFNISTLL